MSQPNPLNFAEIEAEYLLSIGLEEAPYMPTPMLEARLASAGAELNILRETGDNHPREINLQEKIDLLQQISADGKVDDTPGAKSRYIEYIDGLNAFTLAKIEEHQTALEAARQEPPAGE